MKAQLYDLSGNKKADIELPKIFDIFVREDVAAKFYESEKSVQPYSSYKEAGKRHSASGTISHLRHTWKGHYGKGISRTPRKTMWRRGTQFYWVAAEVSHTRGGRTAHPPILWRAEKKINSKETTLAMNSAFAATASKNYILQRYSSLKSIEAAPFVIESVPIKTKDLLNTLKKIFGATYDLVMKQKSVRAGKGKVRGRKYKSNAGLLLVTGKDEKAKFSGLDVKNVRDVMISDLYPLGRLTLYTKKALDELGGKAK